MPIPILSLCSKLITCDSKSLKSFVLVTHSTEWELIPQNNSLVAAHVTMSLKLSHVPNAAFVYWLSCIKVQVKVHLKVHLKVHIEIHRKDQHLLLFYFQLHFKRIIKEHTDGKWLDIVSFSHDVDYAAPCCCVPSLWSVFLMELIRRRLLANQFEWRILCLSFKQMK